MNSDFWLELIPEYIFDKDLFNLFFASEIVKPLKYIGPILSTLTNPSLDIEDEYSFSAAPQIDISISSPGPNSYEDGVAMFSIGLELIFSLLK